MTHLFHSSKPFIGMVHLQYRGSVEKLKEEAVRDAKRLIRGGVDGLLVENWYPQNQTDRFAGSETVKWVEASLNEVIRIATVPVGLNILPLDHVAAILVSKRTGASFVQLDTFVDVVRTDYPNKFIIRPEPEKIMGFIKSFDVQDTRLFVNIQTKHYTTLPVNKRLETSARQAILYGADALVVTGSRTGMETPLWKVEAAKSVVEELYSSIPVYVGSGVTKRNVRPLLRQKADGFIVGSSTKEGRISEEGIFPPVSENKTESLARTIKG